MFGLFKRQKSKYETTLERAQTIIDKYIKDERYHGALFRQRMNLPLNNHHKRIAKLVRNIKKILDKTLKSEKEIRL